MTIYEYPLNESIRTMLRLEHLFDRMGRLMARSDTVDHHFALATIFEVMEVAGRADVKSDLLRELDRQKQQLAAYRGNPSISEAALDDVTARIDSVFTGLNAVPGKAGQELTGNDWLMSIRSRIGIPGGTCEFDLPAYHAWQQHEPTSRRGDLVRWAACLMPFAEALSLVLGLMRDAGVPHRVAAPAGQFQQSLPPGRTYHLLRLRMPDDDDLVPEISGHRLIIQVRLMRPDSEGRLKPANADASFEVTLCA